MEELDAFVRVNGVMHVCRGVCVRVWTCAPPACVGWTPRGEHREVWARGRVGHRAAEANTTRGNE